METTWGPPLARARVLVVAVAFTATGAAALIAQVTWQRVIALHAGMDLESTTTVVAAFLAGLGLGNLAGGRLADRLDRRRALLALAGSSTVVALYELVSVALLYGLYRRFAEALDPLPLRMAFNIALLLVPTFFAGLGLPLIARVVTTDVPGAGTIVGRLNAANTLGASFGALLATWFLLGIYGFEGSLRIAAGLELGAAAFFLALAVAAPARRTEARRAVGTVVTFVLGVGVAAVVREFTTRADQLASVSTWASVGAGALVAAMAYVVLVADLRPPEVGAEGAAPAPAADEGAEEIEAGRRPWSARTWELLYGATGAVALAFEISMFRVVSGVMRSNTYTFGHVLGLYLGLLAFGGLVGSWLRTRVRDQRRAFLWLQFCVGASAMVGLLVFLHVLPRGELAEVFDEWFATDGFASGFAAGRPKNVLFGLVLPLLFMGIPVACMGAAFPFAQGLVTRDLGEVGVRTGRLVFANLVGNVTGTLVATFVLIDRLGSAGTLRLLVVALLAAGVAATVLSAGASRVAGASVVAVVAVAAVTVFPSNGELWRSMANPSTSELVLAEDRTCASALEKGPDEGSGYQLTINATSQNGYPFDDFHVLIGLLPTLVHPDPQEALAVGLGIGSTSYAMLASERTGEVTTVELCSGNYDLVDELADRGVPAFVRLTEDPTHHELVDDGRRHLLVTDERYDVIVPDTLRPNAPGAGNLYSREFQELVRDSLADGGITAGWFPSFRALNAVTTTFPYVVGLQVDSYSGSPFYVASSTPIDVDREQLLERLDALPDDALPADQRERLREAIATTELSCYTDGERAQIAIPDDENRDLFPRDEYSLANGGIDETRIARTCS